MPVHPFRDHQPKLGQGVWLAPTAHISGDIELGDHVSFWFHTVARGDVHWIRIGPGTNIQDNAVLHVSAGTHPLDIGAGVVVGHSAIVHGCTLQDGCLIGIGAKVLDGAVVESGAQVAAGAVVAPGKRVPAGWLAMGIPAKPVRQLSEEERSQIGEIRDRYKGLKEEYRKHLGNGY